MSKARIVAYVRDFNLKTNKFDQLDALIKQASSMGVAGVLIQSPQVLGDTYDELIANMNAISAANLAIVVVPPDQRDR